MLRMPQTRLKPMPTATYRPPSRSPRTSCSPQFIAAPSPPEPEGEGRGGGDGARPAPSPTRHRPDRQPQRPPHPALRGARGGRPPLPEPSLSPGTLGGPSVHPFGGNTPGSVTSTSRTRAPGRRPRFLPLPLEGAGHVDRPPTPATRAAPDTG